MKLRTILSVLLVASGMAASAQNVLTKKLDRYSEGLSREYGQIPSDRQEKLSQLANLIIAERMRNGVANIVFVSQDNAGSSQLAQLWMQAAAYKHNLKGVNTLSAGISESSIPSDALQSLEEAGFKVSNNSTYKNNPRYTIHYAWSENPVLAFSKKVDNFQIPVSNVITVTTEENTNIPTLAGEAAKVELSFSNTEAKTIAREMFFLADKIESSNLISLQP